MSKLSYTTNFFTDKKGNIYLRITSNRKKVEISIKRTIDVKKWNPESQRVKGNSELNGYLIHLENEINKIHTRLISDNKEVSAKQIKDIFLGRDEKSIGLLNYFDEHIEEVRELKSQYKPSVCIQTNLNFHS